MNVCWGDELWSILWLEGLGVGVGDCLCFVSVRVCACECVSGTHVSFVCKISETWVLLEVSLAHGTAATLNSSSYTYLSKILSYKPFYTKCACLVWVNKKRDLFIFPSYLIFLLLTFLGLRSATDLNSTQFSYKQTKKTVQVQLKPPLLNKSTRCLLRISDIELSWAWILLWILLIEYFVIFGHHLADQWSCPLFLFHSFSSDLSLKRLFWFRIDLLEILLISFNFT